MQIEAPPVPVKKGKGSPYSIAEIPVLGSQPAGDVRHKPAVGCH